MFFFFNKLLFDGVTMVGFQKFVVADCETKTWTQVFKGALFEPHTGGSCSRFMFLIQSTVDW